MKSEDGEKKKKMNRNSKKMKYSAYPNSSSE